MRTRGRLDSTLRPRLIDLFSGAGGMTIGFTSSFGHAFEPVWANDNNGYATRTYNTNFGEHCVLGDIVDILRGGAVTIPRAEAVIGGPPCQGFSLLNKSRSEDPRKQLWRPFIKVVEKSGATVFLMENVPQLIGSIEHQMILEAAEELGFKTASARLCAADYGVPQMRWRAFIIGSKFTDPKSVFPPKRTHFPPENGHKRIFAEKEIPFVSNPRPYVTVRDAITDLEPPHGTEIRDVPPPYDLHFGRSPTAKSLQRYMAVPDEGMNRFDLQERAPDLTPECWIRKTSGGTDLFGRLWWDRPSVTIRTEFFKPEKGRYLHPEQHRPITHREAARIQSFHDGFRFIGSKIEVAKQIGNAVPPGLAARLADSVYALLLDVKGKEWRTSSAGRSAVQ
ncbi:MAG: DNA cytosine methyltransferase [Syntrophobacteraceae bacterium]|nr:DNA cytosine methyltransferase [Syntrophobacteraceae bacterium]